MNLKSYAIICFGQLLRNGYRSLIDKVHKKPLRRSFAPDFTEWHASGLGLVMIDGIYQDINDPFFGPKDQMGNSISSPRVVLSNDIISQSDQMNSEIILNALFTMLAAELNSIEGYHKYEGSNGKLYSYGFSGAYSIPVFGSNLSSVSFAVQNDLIKTEIASGKSENLTKSTWDQIGREQAQSRSGNLSNGLAVGSYFSGALASSYKTDIRLNSVNKFITERVHGKIRSPEVLRRANRLDSFKGYKNFSRVGTGLAVLSAGVTIYDGVSNGWENHHTADLAINATIYGTALAFPVVGWIAGGAYFLTDLVVQNYTGKSITENLFD